MDHVSISRSAMNQVLAIRESGAINMLDRPGVRTIAEELDFADLLEWMDEHSDSWGSLIFGRVPVED